MTHPRQLNPLHWSFTDDGTATVSIIIEGMVFSISSTFSGVHTRLSAIIELKEKMKRFLNMHWKFPLAVLTDDRMNPCEYIKVRRKSGEVDPLRTES